MQQRTKDSFDKGILNIINLMKYPIYVVQLNKDVKCTCIVEGTDQANCECPYCLGTGRKITIREAEAACNETGSPSVMRTTTEFVTSRSYYMDETVKLYNDDIIVDNDEVWFVVQYSEFRSFSGNKLYRKYTCANKKYNPDKFLKNFNKIIKG